MVNIINKRFNEICEGKMKTQIKIEKVNIEPNQSDEVTALKEQLAQMKAMFDRLMKEQNTATISESHTTPTVNKTAKKTIKKNK